MRCFDNGAFYSVTVSRGEVDAFRDEWPCSELPDCAITFQFDKRNGDLVDITPTEVDGPDLLALSHDAQACGEERLKR